MEHSLQNNKYGTIIAKQENESHCKTNKLGVNAKQKKYNSLQTQKTQIL